MFSRVHVVRGMTAAMLVVVLTPHPARAQQTDSLPSRALINAFVRMYAPGDSALTPEFEVATMPASLQGVVHLPPMTNVIGTITLGRTEYVLASSPVAPDSLMRLAAREYARPGAPTIGRVEIATTTGSFRATSLSSVVTLPTRSINSLERPDTRGITSSWSTRHR